MKIQKSELQLLSALNTIASENGLKYDEMEHIVLFVLNEINTQIKAQLLTEHLEIEQILNDQITDLKKGDTDGEHPIGD